MRTVKHLDLFNKLKSNAVGNPYVGAGHYDLRKPGPRGAGMGSMNVTMQGASFKTPFVQSSAYKKG